MKLCWNTWKLGDSFRFNFTSENSESKMLIFYEILLENLESTVLIFYEIMSENLESRTLVFGEILFRHCKNDPT